MIIGKLMKSVGSKNVMKCQQKNLLSSLSTSGADLCKDEAQLYSERRLLGYSKEQVCV